MRIIIIDGSDNGDPCMEYVKTLASEHTTVGIAGYNIGHGRGLDAGLKMVKTRYALLFDSDIVMLKSPLLQMLNMFDEDTYGVGYLEKSGLDGYDYGAHAHHKHQEHMFMLHPYFALISVERYFQFAPLVHHGAPFFKAALDIHKQGLTSKIIKEFPGLGHSSGVGWTWKGEPREYIEHHPGNTRRLRREKGLPEIESGWER